MTTQELETQLQQGHTLRAIIGYRYIFFASQNAQWGYIIHKQSYGTGHVRPLPYKTARRAIRQMLTYAPADKWEVVS